MKTLNLRPYQQAALDRMLKAIDAKERLLCCLPCGAGKTEVAAAAMIIAAAKGDRCIFFAHRRELIKQTAKRLRAYGASAGCYMAGEMYTNDRIQVASIHTVASRKHMPRADLIVIDEAHLSLSDQYLSVLNAAKEDGIPVIGLTATPYRGSERECFSAHYDDYHVAIQPKQLINEGYQAFPEWYAEGDFERARNEVKMRMRAGNFVDSDAVDFVKAAGGFNTLRDSWLKHARGLRTIVFCTTIAEAEGVWNHLNQMGEGKWGMIDSKRKDSDNQQAINEFRRGDLIGLVNVNMVSEGFDVPDCSCVVLNTTTASSIRLIQSVGRCQRPKERAVVIDLGDHYSRAMDNNTRLVLPWFDIVPQWESWEKQEAERKKQEEIRKVKERDAAMEMDLSIKAVELVQMSDGRTISGLGIPPDGVYSAKEASRIAHLLPEYGRIIHGVWGAITLAGGVVMPYRYADYYRGNLEAQASKTAKDMAFGGRSKWIIIASKDAGLSNDKIKESESIRKRMIEQAKENRLRSLQS